MTRQDQKAFDAAFNRLAKAGLIHDVDTAAKAIYFDSLADLPVWAVERAEVQLRRHPVKFFTSAVWHETAAEILRDQRRRDNMALATKRLQPEHCSRCKDTGMRPSDADPDRVTHCECRDTNPNYQASRARDLVVAEGRADVPSTQESGRLADQVRDFKRLSSGE